MPQQQKKPVVDETELKVLKVMMAQHGYKVSDLHRLTGISPRRLTNVLCGGDASWPPRAAINAAIGAEIFSKPAPSVPAIPQSHPLTPHDRMLRASQITTRPLPHS